MVSNISLMSELNVDTLNKLTYERSLIWADLMKKCSSKAEKECIPLTEIDTLFADENDTNDSLSSIEEADENEEIINVPKFQTTLLKKNISKHETINELFNETNNPENKEIKTFLNSTLPVFEAHDRNLSKSGLLPILNSFNAKKIESKMGGWLERNETLKNFPSACEEISPIPKSPVYYYAKSDDSDESIQSDDTARYIRSSRKHKREKLSPCNTMSIKTYRLLKSRREALREKYGHLTEGMSEHCQLTLKHNRNSVPCHRSLKPISQSAICKKKHLLNSLPRKKRLRKMHLNGNDSNSTDESSDDLDMCYARQKLNRHRMDRDLRLAYSPQYLKYHSMCACADCRRKTLTHSLGMKKSHKAYVMHSHYLEQKARKKKKESECHCCNGDRLCDETIHLADTSTEDWVVENVYSPKAAKYACSKQRKSLNNVQSEYDVLTTLKKTKLSKNLFLANLDMEPDDIGDPFTTPLTSRIPQPLCSTYRSQHNETDTAAINDKLKTENRKKTKLKNSTKEQSSYSKLDTQIDGAGSLKKKDTAKHILKEKEKEADSVQKILKKKDGEKQLLKEKEKEADSVQKILKKKDGEKQILKEKEKEADSVQKSLKKKDATEEILNMRRSLRNKKENKADIVEKSLKKKKTKAGSSKKLEMILEISEEETDSKPKDCRYPLRSATKTKPTTKRIINKKTKQTPAKSKDIKTKTIEEECIMLCDTTGGDNSMETVEKISDTNSNGSNDCAQVSSTTEIPVEKILIYAPAHYDSLPEENVDGEFIVINNEFLTKALDHDVAAKFIKYYVGRRRFP